MISAELRSTAQENEEAWSSALMACIHAFGVIEKVITDVDWYEDEIDKIKMMLSTQSGMISTGDEELDQELRDSLLKQKNDDADEAWKELEKRCQASEDQLAEGPTAENIRTLVEAGYLGQIGYYTTGNVDYYHIEGDEADELALQIEAAINGDEDAIEFLEDHPMALALLTSVVHRSLTAKDQGTELSEGELEFLERLYGSLGGDEGEFLAFVEKIGESELDPTLRDDLTRNLANGMLGLSNEALGGGMDRLPSDVREVALGPEKFDPQAVIDGKDPQDYMSAYRAWGSQFSTLAEFLDSSGPGLVGGTEFSTSLLATTATNIHFADFYGGEPDQEAYQDIIGVAARNPEANYIMLTGNDFSGEEYSHHDNHKNVTPESFLGSIYTRDWSDDGAAVSSVTNWIEHFQNSDDQDKVDRGSEAFLALLETITTPEMQEKLGETGHDVEDKANDVTWENVSFTHLNPEIADSFADLFLNNIEAMESTIGFNIDGAGGDDPTLNSVENRYRGEGNLEIDPMTRLAFAEYIVGSEEAASRLKTASFFRTEEAAATYFGDYPPDHAEARASGIFNSLIDKAIDNEHENRVNNTNKAIDYKNQVNNNSVDMAAAIFNEIPVPGVSTISEVMKQGFKEVLSMDSIDIQRDTSSDFSPIALNNRANIHAAIAVENSGEYEFGEDVEYLRDPNTGEISLDPHRWLNEDEEFDAEAYQDAADSILKELRDEKWPDAENELGGSVVEGFGEHYDLGREALDSRT